MDASAASASAEGLVDRYARVRTATLALTRGLSEEDQNLQSMTEASPVKWHLAHTSWFFETFLLGEHVAGYRPFHPRFRHLFNSYYNAVGEQFARGQRGLLSRPALSEVHAYRAHVDAAMAALLDAGDAAVGALVQLGLAHEEQHQELLVTDLKHALAQNPLAPALTRLPPPSGVMPPPPAWVDMPEGMYEVGHDRSSFCFDNETPRHRVYQRHARVASRPVTNAEYLAFIDDGGYARPQLWLSDGWQWRQLDRVDLPLYWRRDVDGPVAYTLGGLRPVDPAEPVCHVSHYEADAYARWAGARLPTETEWEIAARARDTDDGDFLDPTRLHPRVLEAATAWFGGVWEWTASPYVAYPGYHPGAGAIGEYNGKFMSNQMVLRGGSCATPAGHVRESYRNFFPPNARWQLSGLRLAQDV